MNATSTARVREHRRKTQLHRAEVAAELTRRVPSKLLVDHYRDLSPAQLDELMWRLTEAALVSSRGNKRVALDAYFTPPLLARACCNRLGDLVQVQWTILEPHGGKGAFVNAASDVWPGVEITTVDLKLRKSLQRSPAKWKFRADFLTWSPGQTYELIVGNPPFNAAEPHVDRALSLLKQGGHLAFILRIDFLGSVHRARGIWARKGLRWFIPIAPRPSFVRGGNDVTDVALFVWEDGWKGDWEGLSPIVWRAELERGGA